MEEYLGYKEIIPTDDELNAVFQPNGDNLFGCLQNEYLIAKDNEGNILELLKCVDGKMIKVPFKTITGRFLGKVKPRNVHQQLAIDLLYDTDTTVKIITGKFGTGKDFLMCAVAKKLFMSEITLRLRIPILLDFCPETIMKKCCHSLCRWQTTSAVWMGLV